MRKKLSLLLAAVISIGLLSGCGQKTKKDADGAFYNNKFNEKSMATIIGKDTEIAENKNLQFCKASGFCFTRPLDWREVSNQHCIDEYVSEPNLYMFKYMPIEQTKLMDSINKDTMSKEEINKIESTAHDSEFYVFAIYRVNEADTATQDNAKETETHFENKEKLCTVGKDTLYFAYNDKVPKSSFSDDDKADLNNILSTIKDVKYSIMVFPPTDSSK